MQDKKDILDWDLLLIEKLADILIDIYKEKDLELVSEEVTTLDFIIENRRLPFQYEYIQMMRIFTIEYALVHESESNILILKDKWVDRIMRHPDIENMVAGSDGIEVHKYICESLEEHINFCSTEGIEVIQKRVLGYLIMEEKFIEELDIYYNITPNYKIIIHCIYNFKRELLQPIFDKFNELNHFNEPIYLKCFEGSIVDEILKSERGVYEKKYGFVPTLRGFGMYLLNIGSKNIKEMAMNVKGVPSQIEIFLADYVVDKLETIDNNIQQVKSKRQTLIDITPQQTLSIETNTATKEKRNLDLQHQEIGLLHYYDKLPLNDNNAQRIAEKYGQGSGVTLMKHYRAVNKSETERRNHKHAKKYLETVIPLLTKKEGIEEAKQDLANVKTR